MDSIETCQIQLENGELSKDRLVIGVHCSQGKQLNSGFISLDSSLSLFVFPSFPFKF